MAFKPKQKEFKSIAGNKYTFQTVPHSKYLGIMDIAADAEGKPSLARLYPAILENVVVQPQDLNVDDFEDFRELTDVCENALMFQQG
ncbi:hypothetical protein AMS60_05630 [Bacillus sp. FJAT-21945]|nr:hypothetical protein AMS60_05630 [Bacillus sp. FJAT-21945]